MPGILASHCLKIPPIEGAFLLHSAPFSSPERRKIGSPARFRWGARAVLAGGLWSQPRSVSNGAGFVGSGSLQGGLLAK